MKLILLDEHTAAQVAELIRTFSDTSRVRILSALVHKEAITRSLAEMVGLAKSAASHHLQGLRQIRIIQANRNGKEAFYIVEDTHLISLFQLGARHVQEE